MTSQIDASSRVALAAMLHDLGKFAERARLECGKERLDTFKQLDCPHWDGRPTHIHAAYTSVGFTVIENHLPTRNQLMAYPFSQPDHHDADDSIFNAAARHHRPESFLQWVIATADRLASGFERTEFQSYNQSEEGTSTGRNHYQARLLTLFESIRLNGGANHESANYCLPLQPLSAESIFPQQRNVIEPSDNGKAQAEYAELWKSFVSGLEKIPTSHRVNLPLWLDHFDSAWLTFTHAIPSATAGKTRPDVSLYDHTRTTAALATALWCWHEFNARTDSVAVVHLKNRSDYDEQKYLLIQGDFFGIQDFVFATGGETNKHAAKLLRGRSFQVSLFTELAALKLLDDLGLPPTSQIINAAGKFLIVAPNTPDVVSALQAARSDLDAWFLKNTFGLAGIGLAWTTATSNDFLQKGEREGFGRLMQRLVDELTIAKHRRFDLCSSGGRIFTEAEYPYGACLYNGRLPADRDNQTCAISRDQKTIGEALVKFDRILVLEQDSSDALRSGKHVTKLELPVFGYTLAFTSSEDIVGKFGELAGNGSLRRCWDFSSADAEDKEGASPLWSGYAHRSISGYVPRVTADDLGSLRDRYLGMDDWPDEDDLKPMDMLACEDRHPCGDSIGKWVGVSALGVLKGDVDNLGEIFRIGNRQPTFAKYASLSRQMNAFFAIWLPWRLAREHRSVYTVFAGGDDFFLIGPWRSVQKLAHDMRQEFSRYVASNPAIHFSAGIATQKPGAPIHALAELAEEALGKAKGYQGQNGQPSKDAITCFGETLPWSAWPAIETAYARLGELRHDFKLSTGYVYGLLHFVEMERETRAGRPDASIWRSRFQYRTRRFVVDKLRGLDESARRQRFTQLITDIGAKGIGELGPNYRIVLFNHLYQFRDR